MLASLVFTALLAAAPAAPAAPAERLDALSFDNGAYLVEEGRAYQDARGITGWAGWHLADGDEAQGWCSPEGAPTGHAFAWELDARWRLERLVLSTRNTEEEGYPGISAKTVEVFVGEGSALRRLGTFSVGRSERREHALPAGTIARRVRVVVTANHGHPQFTELMEVEVLGVREGKPATPAFAGDFATNYGPIRLVTDGDTVRGCYDWTDGATLDGVVDGRVARVTWSEPNDDGPRSGSATFALSPDGGAIWGIWYANGAAQGTWEGPRSTTGEQRAKCTPRRRSALETLRKEKRLVLYGIRFDSNADVPRPESEPTLAELQGLLAQDAKLRLVVEGHTDATNTDAYNLDLSQRRARAVVAALVKRGADGRRLEPKGFGRTRPVADNATAQGRALNRRVEVSVAAP